MKDAATLLALAEGSVDREFRKRICTAAMRVAEAELFSGPVELGRSLSEYEANLALKRRAEEQALNAMIEVVLFAKTRGDEIVQARAHAAIAGEG